MCWHLFDNQTFNSSASVDFDKCYSMSTFVRFWSCYNIFICITQVNWKKWKSIKVRVVWGDWVRLESSSCSILGLMINVTLLWCEAWMFDLMPDTRLTSFVGWVCSCHTTMPLSYSSNTIGLHTNRQQTAYPTSRIPLKKIYRTLDNHFH